MKRFLFAASLLALTAVPAFAARDQIRFAGSSTVYPFTTTDVEAFSKATGITEFIAEYVSAKALGEDGYLAGKGLVTLPEDPLEKTRAIASALTVLTAEDVK